eukprot:2276781-Prymnesium_polylepis.1
MAGATLGHRHRGSGTLVRVLSDGRRVIKFDNSATLRRYDEGEMVKFDYMIADCTETPKRDAAHILDHALNLCVLWDMPDLMQQVLVSSAHISAVRSAPYLDKALHQAL